MADTKISALTELAETPATGDLVAIVDVSDTTQAATGSTKKITRSNLVGGLATAADLTAHTDDTADAHDASAVSVTPAGGIAATDVQAALEELDTEKSGTAHNHTGTYQPAGDTLTSLEGLSLAAGDILYATAADTLTRLPKGTAGQVLTVNSGATAPEWAAASGGGSAATPRFNFAVNGANNALTTNGSAFSNTSGTGAAVTYQTSNGAYKLESGSTAATGRANFYISSYWSVYGSANNIDWGEDPSCLMVLNIQKSTGDVVGFSGLHHGTNAATLSTTVRHAGIYWTTVAGTTTIYASNANGTTQTSTDITASFNANTTTNTVDKVYITMTSGTNIKFYVNGTLAATHTTNMPTGVLDAGGNGYFMGGYLKNGTTAGTPSLSIYHIEAGFNAI